MLSKPGDIVLDPFAGRGTTLLEARAADRMPLASDLNPIAVALNEAKNANVAPLTVTVRINELESAYDAILHLPHAHVQSDNIQLIFHERTLAQLCYLRRRLGRSDCSTDKFLIGAILGILHGSERKDGSSGYASISMPNTFSMSPDYVRRYVETNRLQRVERNVFELLRLKVARMFEAAPALGPPGVVAQADAKSISDHPAFELYRGKVQLVLTSPPYLDVVNYAKQNWIRCWFLGVEADSVHDELDDNLTLQSWLDFMGQALVQIENMMAPDGTAVFVIGDVARSSRSVMPIAREFLRRVQHEQRFSYVGCVSDHLQIGAKTTRIWGDTKGRATAVDRIVVLSNSRPQFDNSELSSILGDATGQPIGTLDVDTLEAIAVEFAGGGNS